MLNKINLHLGGIMKININNQKQGLSKKLKMIIAISVIVIAVVSLSIIFIPKIFGNGNQSAILTFQNAIVAVDNNNYKNGSISIEYDGLPHTIKIIGIPASASVEYEPTNTFVNVGNYEIVAKISQDGYATLKMNIKLEIYTAYTVSFVESRMLDIENVVAEVKVKSGESLKAEQLPEPNSVVGYTSRWEKTESELLEIKVNIDMTINAEYDIITYHINYVLNGGTNHIGNPSTFTVLDLPIVFADANKTSAYFEGWYEDDTFDIMYGVVTGIYAENFTEKDITVYARFMNDTTGLEYNLYDEDSQYTTDPANAKFARVSAYNGEDVLIVIPKIYSIVTNEGTSFNIPVTGIDGGAFGDNDNISIRKILLHENITTIGDRAFYNFLNLKSFTFNEGITMVNEGVLGNCLYLKEVILSNTITEIRNSAFIYDWSLESIYMPKGLTNIEASAFKNCNNLSSIYYAGTSEEWDAITKGVSKNENNENVLEKATVYFYSENEPTTEGNYWHYNVRGQFEVWDNK